MLKKVDRKNRFVSMFDPKTGFYVRRGRKRCRSIEINY